MEPTREQPPVVSVDPAVPSGMIADLSRCAPRPGGAAARRQRPEGPALLRG
jgi:hypothetical protein